MSKKKICLSIDDQLLMKVEAIRNLEKRGSRSNAICALLKVEDYEFSLINKELIARKK